MIFLITGLASVSTVLFGAIQYISDPYAIYLTARNIRISMQSVETSPVIYEEEGWSVVDEWELVKTKYIWM